MKKFSSIIFNKNIIAAIIAAIMFPSISQAQFLKSLLNKATQAATQSSKRAVDAKDSSVLIKPKLDSLSAALKKMSADTIGSTRNYSTQQRLAVSPADSAAAINSFKNGAGGSGILYQYLDITNIKMQGRDSTFKDTMSIAIADNYNMRSENGLGGIKTQTINYAGMPKYSIILISQSKTYMLHIKDTANSVASDKLSYIVTKVGNENIQGYNCIHAKLTIVMDRNKQITEDIWTSKDVPGYLNLKKMSALQNVTPKMMQAIDQAGCDGFFVKMVMQNMGYSMTMLLINSSRKNFPSSMFQIPAGYTQARNVNTASQLTKIW